jgi:uncharacterized protein YcbX
MTAPAGTATAGPAAVGVVSALRRYPVKSMLGEALTEAVLAAGGVEGDRALALLDASTGRVATAKQPRLWRALLRFTAAHEGAAVRITLPDGRSVGADDEGLDELLSEVLGRTVVLSDTRPADATVERPAPEDVLAHGVEAEVPYETLEIARGTTGATFVENGWVGREITIGGVRLRGTQPTPRCSVPTLEHGDLPRAPHAVRNLLADNRVEVPGFGVLPCAGVYAEVLDGGVVREGDPVVLH